MRIFMSPLEAGKEIERTLFEMGIRSHAASYQDKIASTDPDFETRELVGYSFRIEGSFTRESRLKLLNSFGFEEDYADRELRERLSDRYFNPGRSWKSRLEIWEKFLQSDGYFAYTYNERIREQWERARRRLETDPDSRQIVITVYDQHKDIAHWGGGARVPCTFHYHFMSRVFSGVRKLNMIHAMRSCDFYTHWPYDLVLAMGLQVEMAHQINQEVGWIMQSIDSLHAFRKDWKKRGNIF